MCNWRAWLLPGLLTLLILTALAIMVRGGPIEADLTARSADRFAQDGTPWAAAVLDGRDVTLSGVAPTEVARDAAIAAANRVPGVYRVDPSGLTLLPLADPYALSFTKAPDSITVTGSFPDGATRASVLDSVRASMGGATLVDETQLARGAPSGFAALAGFAAAGLPALDTGTIALSGPSLSVQGDATTLESYTSEIARLDAPVDGLALGTIAIQPPAISPYTWDAQSTAAGVTLSGYVPDEATRAAILAAAAPLGAVTDEMEVGFGAPEGFADAASQLLGQMAGLDNASASMDDLNLTLSGDAAGSDAYQSANAFLGTIPAGFDSLSGRIAPPVADPFVTSLAKTSDGYVLSGVLASETDRAVILDALQGQGASVTDTTTIARGGPNGVDIGTLFANASATLGDLVEGTATLTGSDFAVSGTSVSFGEADAAQAALAGLASGNLAVTADIVPGPASPFTFDVSTSETGIVLSGFVPSEDKRQDVLADLETFFPARAITDNLVVAQGAPSGFDAVVRAGLRGLGRLSEGSFTLSDTLANLTGTALFQRSVEQIEIGIVSAAPSSFTFTTDVDLLPPPAIVDRVQCQQLFARLLAGNRIRFETASARIDPVSLGLMDRLVRTLQSCPDANVEIGGHTDSQGSDESNLTLSQARAEAVLTYVVEAGIAPSRIQAVGYGETDPIADNETEEGRALNRRIEFTVAR